MIKSIESLCLFVDDFSACFDFYKNKLELPLEIEDDNFAAFRIGSMLLEIYQKEKGYNFMVPEKFMHKGICGTFGFVVDDVDTFTTILKEKEIEIIDGPKNSTWGQRMVFFRDPDGNVWEAYTK